MPPVRKVRMRCRFRKERQPRIEPLERRLLLASIWQNQFFPLDVNADGVVLPVDVLIDINRLNQVGSGPLPYPEGKVTNFYDTSGDGLNSPIDALLGINALNNDVAPPTMMLELAHDSAPGGLTNNDLVTNDARITGSVQDLTGVAQLQAQVDGGGFHDAAIDPTGVFLFDPGLANDGSDDGPHVVQFQATDGRGNRSAIFEIAFELDTLGPAAPTFQLGLLSDSDPAGDDETDQSPVTLRGTAEPQTRVEVSDGNAVTFADDVGDFTLFGVSLKLGANLVELVTVDEAGNTTPAQRTITRLADSEAFLLAEDNGFVVEATQLVEFGQPAGTRTVSFATDAFIDTSDATAIVEDTFLVYLVDPADPSTTLLDRGQNGTALFSWNGERAEYPSGLVKFDGTMVSIDVTSLSNRSEGQLVFQLLNHDADMGSQVAISHVVSAIDATGDSQPAFPAEQEQVSSGGAVDLASFTPTSSIDVRVENVRFDSDSGRYAADLRVRNEGASTGRQVAVVLSDLPNEAEVVNSSGTDSAGSPYFNLAPAIPAGGLQAGRASASVTVLIDNPDPVRFAWKTEVLSEGANRPPAFDNTLGKLSVLAGGFLEVEVSATDQDGDPLAFHVRSDDPLPHGTIDRIRGTLGFSPSPEEVGSYAFTLIVGDGAGESTQLVELEVLADTVATTRLSGHVVTTGEQPLGDVPIELGRLQTMTAADGTFTVELPPLDFPTAEFDIPVPLGDPVFDPLSTGSQTIDLRRSRFDATTGTSTSNPRRHPNLVTTYIDAGMVYGSDAGRAAALRAGDGSGKLKTSTGNLLPFNSPAFFPNGPLPNVNSGIQDPTTLFAAGDVRVNDTVALAALQTVFLREHNRLADAMALADPTLTGDEIYERARRQVGAQIQVITYQEYLPLVLGEGVLDAFASYDEEMNPGASSFLTTAALRYGHSQQNPLFLRTDEAGQEIPAGHLSLRDATFTSEPIVNEGIDPILRGLAAQQAQAVDVLMIDEMRNVLFGPPGAGGIDLAAVDIQRARDHGLPGYNQVRRDYGLEPAESFADISSDPDVQAALESTYGSVEKVDAWLGGLAEDHVAGAMVGELFSTALLEQFRRLRAGDRWWYENEQFTDAELAELRGTTLSDIVLRNTAITALPDNVFTTGAIPNTPPPGGDPADQPATQYRSFDGTGNNTEHPEWGSSGQNLLRRTTVAYGDGVSSPSGADQPNARTISNQVLAQSQSGPNQVGATDYVTLWGQFLAHDISFTPEGSSDTLKIHAERVGDEITYPFIAEKVDLLLGRELYEGVDNVISRPIYLPAIDTDNAVQIDPQQDITVTTAALPGASVFVAAGTLEDREGHPFDGKLSIIEVPVDLTPAALPPYLNPDLVVTIQPGDMVFTTPAPLSLPNRAGFPAGTELDLWSINPTTGDFDIVGRARVRADGSVWDTIEGGIRNSSWHLGTPTGSRGNGGGGSNEPDQQPLDDLQDETPVQGCDDCEEMRDILLSDVALHSGAFQETHALIPYRSQGIARGITLYYDSLRAEPHQTLRYSFQVAPDFVARPADDTEQLLTALVTLDAGNASNFTQREQHFWSVPSLTSGKRVGAGTLVDLTDQPSGALSYELSAGFLQISGEDTSGRLNPDNGGEPLTGRLLSVNSMKSPLGSGWGIAGFQEIVRQDEGALLVNGDGSELWFDRTPEGDYQSPPDEFSTLVYSEANDSFTRTAKDGTQLSFVPLERSPLMGTDQKVWALSSVLDTRGRETALEYDTDRSRLVGITDPVGEQTLFLYDNGRIDAIRTPRGTTELAYENDNLAEITDTNGAVRGFGYLVGRHLLNTEVTRRSETEEPLEGTIEYDKFGRVQEAEGADEGRVRVVAAQVLGLALPSETRGRLLGNRVQPPQDPPPAQDDFGNTARFVDANGNVTFYELDRLRQLRSRSDSSGRRATTTRNDRNLVTEKRDGRGNLTSLGYDGEGNVTSFQVSGQFTSFAGRSVQMGTGPIATTTGDINGDGFTDFVVANREGVRKLNVFLGTRAGSLQPFGAIDLQGRAPADVALHDVTGDGALDVLAVDGDFAGNRLAVWGGNGDGTFKPYLEQPITAFGSILVRSKPTAYGRATLVGSADPA